MSKRHLSVKWGKITSVGGCTSAAAQIATWRQIAAKSKTRPVSNYEHVGLAIKVFSTSMPSRKRTGFSHILNESN